jgi:urease alpha subunit
LAEAGNADAGAGCTAAGIVANISMNHQPPMTHSLTIPLADIIAGVTMIYNARGMANHDHFIQVTAADFAALRSGTTITKFACNGGDHQFVLNCGTAPPGGAPNCGGAANMCGLTNTTFCI